MHKIALDISDNSADIAVSDESAVTLSVAGEYVGNPTPIYEGAYTVTPGDNEQVLETSGYKLSENIKVKPIPNNYGLITWNGSIITVS